MEHQHNAAHDIIDTEIFYAQFLQQNSSRIETQQNDNDAPYEKEHRISEYHLFSV